jgi:hypothetical protein
MISAAVNSLFFSGISLDPSKTTLTQTTSKQEFVRGEVFIPQSIDPYQRMTEAKNIIASGGSLFAYNRENKRG